MAIPVAVIAGWLALVERVAALWQRLRGKGGQGDPPPPKYRPRPTGAVWWALLPLAALALSGCRWMSRGIMCLVLVATVALSGCASAPTWDRDEIEALCQVALDKDADGDCLPCEPCPPCPQLPPVAAPVPEPPAPPPPADGGAPVPPPAGDDDHGDEAPSPVFVWKPVADTAPVLYIVTPSQLDCESVTVVPRQGAKEVGAYRPPRANGQRQHFGFKHKGEHYGNKVKVVCKLRDGGAKMWTIPHGAKRWEGR